MYLPQLSNFIPTSNIATITKYIYTNSCTYWVQMHIHVYEG